MKENNKIVSDEAKKQEDEVVEKMPFCTVAASPEHHRGDDEAEEPCDDGRAG
jgi:hypothetical protein